MRRKRLLTIGATGILAFMLVLAGCGKAEPNNDKAVSQEQPISSSKVEEEAKPDKTKISKETGDLAPKAAPLVHPTATLRFAGESNVRATNGQDVTTSLNLTDPPFTAVFLTNSGKYNMYMRTDGIWMYGLAGNSAKGNKLTITMAAGYVIKTITIDFIEGYSEAAEVSAGGDVVTGLNGRYTINANSFVLLANAGASESDLQVRFNSILIEYEFPTAEEMIEYGLTTSSSLSYSYTKDLDVANDVLDRGLTESTTANSYKDWSGKTDESGIVFAGNSAGGNNSIQLRTTNDSGVITTANSSPLFVKSITIHWNSNTSASRRIDVYGKDTAYSATSDLFDDEKKGDLLGSSSFTVNGESKEETINVDGFYKFIGLRAFTGAVYLDSISICWETVPDYSYSNVAIRFGNLMEQSLWTRLNAESTIKGYGVMLSTPGYLGENEIKTWYANNSLAAVDEDGLDDAIATACGANIGAVKNFYTKITGEKTNPAVATAAQKGALEGDYYIWNLYKNISTEPDNRKTSYTAVAYIRVASGIVFLRQTTASAKSLAADLIDNDVYADDSFDGSLHELANLA